MRKISIFIILLSMIPAPIFCVDWYVRPSGGSYGSENGTSYVNAWDGLNNVVWGGAGVNPGDTLYICGTHLYKDDSGSWGKPTNINLVTGSAGNVITIRGDYPGDEGIVWGHIIPSHESWVYEGSNTYSITIAITTIGAWVLEDIHDTSYTLLTKKNSIQEVKDNPGTYYASSYATGNTLYVHCSDNGDPTDRIALARNGWNFVYPSNASYITITDLKCYGHYRFVFSKGQNCSHLTWRNFTLHISPGYDGFGIYDGNHYFTWDNCIIEYVRTGIYTVSNTDNAPSYCTVRNCIVRECGTSDHVAPTGDYHGIAFQGGHDNLIEKNEVYQSDLGIGFYLDENMNFYNNIVRFNYVHDLTMYGTANGLHFSGDADIDLSNKKVTGNKCYYNVLIGNGKYKSRGIYAKYDIECYNNVVYGFDWGIVSTYTNNGKNPSSIIMKNNIIMNSGTYHIFFDASGCPPGTYTIESDCNLCYPISGDQFYLKDLGSPNNLTFSEWQNLSRPGCTFDPNSLTSDPKFTNATGSYSKDTDFQLQSASPAIDKGIDVGLTQDYQGTQIHLGFAPDIGAFECVKSLYIKTSAVPKSGDFPLTVNFTGDAMGDFPPFNFSWNFGDGTSSSTKNPSHTYSTEGNFTATLTVTDSKNNNETNFLYITAYSPIKSLTISSVTGYPSPGEGGTTEPSPGVHLYPRGDSVQIKGLSYNNYRFSKWIGDISISDIFKKDASIIMDKDKSISSFFCAKCGDVNGDLSITAADAQTAFEIFLKKIANPTECQKENADVNCDGTKTVPYITAADAQAIFEKFLGRNELPSDCSGNSRNASFANKLTHISKIRLVINNQEAKSGEEVVIPVIIENPFIFKSFGFDLNFPPKVVEFIALERTDLLKDFIQVDANEISIGVLRVGGYSGKTVRTESPEIMLALIFRAIDDIKSLNLFLITNTFNDSSKESDRKKLPAKK